jgi:L-lysine 2,3-aminomutase
VNKEMKGKNIAHISRNPFFQTRKKKEQELLQQVTSLYPFHASEHYLSLIDRNEYPQTVQLVLSDEYGGIYRFCLRIRLFMDCPRQTIKDYVPALGYIRDHLKLTEDRELVSLIQSESTPGKKTYFMAHFNHPSEISPQSIDPIRHLQRAVTVVVNQTPVIEGVNTDPAVMADLFKKLSFIRVSPYYVFQYRQIFGNRVFTVPVERLYQVMQSAFQRCSGLATHARFIMSHSTGEIEVVGQNSHDIFIRYHQTTDPG